MAKIPWYYGGKGSYGTGGVNYFATAIAPQNQNGTEANEQSTVRTAGVFSNLIIRVWQNDDLASTLVFRKAAADGSQTVAIGNSATGEFEDTTHTDTVAAADLINTKLTAGAGGTTIRPSNIGYLFAATTNTVSRYLTPAQSFSTDSASAYPAIVTDGSPATSETAAEQLKMRLGGTLKNFNVMVSSNPRALSATTYGSRIGGAGGNLAISVPASTTGQFEDTSHSDTIASGNLVNFIVTTGIGITNAIVANIFVEIETTDSTSQWANGRAVTVNANVTNYYPMMGGLNSAANYTTETQAQSKSGVAQTVSLAEAYVSANTLTADSTLKLRKNAGNGTISVSLTAGTTGWFEDTSHSDALVATDEITWQLITGATGTSLTLKFISALDSLAAATPVVSPYNGNQFFQLLGIGT